MEQDNRNNNIKLMIITFIICALIFVPVGFVLGKYMAEQSESHETKGNTDVQDNKNNLKENDSDEKENLDDNDAMDKDENDKSVENNDNSSSTPKVCKGFIDAVYEGGYSDNVENIDIYLTLTLKKDGTYSAIYRNSEANEGTYSIDNNKLTTSACPSYGPCDEKIVLSYDITSDCSTIKWGDSDSYQYNLNKK